MNYNKETTTKSGSRSAHPWQGGEDVALDRLDSVSDYKLTRNGLVGTEYSTKFSAFFASGCISPRYI